MLGTAVKTVLTPLAVVKDVIEVVEGNDPENTANLVDSAVDSVDKALSDLIEGDL